MFLNIQKQTNKTNTEKTEKLPVMVWIFGGGFSFGGSSFPSIRGENIVTKDVMFASINYRVGPLGFMARDDKGTGGMNGILDLVLGIKWLYDNVEKFGGDKDEITIAGLSSGSIATCLLAASPLTKGLIKGVILESGACTGSIYQPNSP